MRKFVLLLSMILLSSCSTVLVYHNAEKSQEKFKSDLLECARMSSNGATFNVTAPASTFDPNVSNGQNVATGVAAGFASGWAAAAAKFEQQQKCMFVRGYDLYRVDGEHNRKIRSLKGEADLQYRAEIGTAPQPSGVREPIQDTWYRPGQQQD